MILTAPPAQAEAMLPKQHGFRVKLEAVEMLPQWVSIVATTLAGTVSEGLIESLRQELEQQPEVGRVVLENDKPQRSYPDELSVFAIQFSSEWTQGHLELEASEITSKARDLFRSILANGSDEHTPELQWSACHSHRWLYAKPGQQSLIQDQFLDDGNGLSICGDYFGDPQLDGVERAFVSASSLARSLIEAHELSGETADV